MTRPHALSLILLLCSATGTSGLVLGAEPAPALVSGLPDFADLAEAVLPSTVHIRVERGAAAAAGLQQLQRDLQLPTSPHSPAKKGQTTGSGVIVDASGVILTNHHVVNGARRVLITLSDKREFAAEVVGTDPRTDIAVLRIDAGGALQAAVLGDSDTLRVGQWVVAVGSPFDFHFSVTAGIVSARGRRGLAQDEIQDYIQTDAAVNPGSSGGPLFNLAGEVMGLNTAIYSPNHEQSQNAGISFAIPSNMAKRISDELLQTGRVVYAGIGAITRDRRPGPDEPRPGAEVTQVASRGPAERAGLRRGDVVIAVNGEPVGSAADFRGSILAKGVGAKITLRYQRGDREREARVKAVDERDLGRWEQTPEAVKWAGASLVLAQSALLGEHGIVLPKHASPGLLVLAVVPNSSADIAGLAPGDVLLEVQRKPIEGVDHLLGQLRGRNTAMVGYWRGTGMLLAAVGGLQDG
jgi:S1-C subfamily serine protease